MKKAGKSKVTHMLIMLALILFVVAHPVEAKSLKTGEVYSSLDGKRAIEVISQKELEITKGGDILLAQYNFKGGKLRIVYTALGTTLVEYYELLSEGLKDKDGNILYSKKGLTVLPNRDRIAKDDIKNAFTACQAYYSDFPKATVDMKKLREYGYRQSEGVIIRIRDGRINYLKIESKHKDGSEVFFINSQGTISHKPKSN